MENIEKIFKKYNLNINKQQKINFEKYYEMLVETNKVLNLTAITEENDVLLKHFLDSVLPIDLIKENASIVDVGTGAGFPALPIKIMRPDLHVFMVDSLNKRINFLNNVISELNLSKICAIHSRAEDFAKKSRENFDYAVARAVAPLNTLAEYLLPLVKVGGFALIYKSSKLNEELELSKKAISVLGGEVLDMKNFYIEEGDFSRTVLIIKKIKATPKQYPRDKNKPRISPIA